MVAISTYLHVFRLNFVLYFCEYGIEVDTWYWLEKYQENQEDGTIVNSKENLKEKEQLQRDPC